MFSPCKIGLTNVPTEENVGWPLILTAYVDVSPVALTQVIVIFIWWVRYWICVC
jgi:hypothetical protein